MNPIKRLIANGGSSGTNSSDNISSGSSGGKVSKASPATAQTKSAPRNTAFNIFLRGQQLNPQRPAVTTTPDTSPSIPAFQVPPSYFSSRHNALVRTYSQDSAHFGPCSSVSSLGLETGLSMDNDPTPSSSSSSEDEGYYDADDIISLGRRQSISVCNISSRNDSNSTKSSQERFNGFFKRSFSSSSGSDAYNFSGPARTTTRRFISDVKSLRPKVKSFLRISKELQDELSPLDCEIKQEAKVTSLLRVDDDDGSGDASPLATTSLPPPSLPVQALAGGSGARMDSPSVKRKANVIDTVLEPVYVKRRAVSPGYVSPVAGSPTRSIKHLRDTSDGLERMRLA